jgi:hypothetical protein
MPDSHALSSCRRFALAFALALGVLGCSGDGESRGRGSGSGAGGVSSGAGGADATGTGGGFQNPGPTTLGDDDAGADASMGPIRDFEGCKADGDCGKGTGLSCRYDLCVPDPSACENGDGCIQDAYCDATNKECIPFGVPADVDHDPSCRLEIAIDALLPQVQCRWEAPPAGDPNPTHVQAMATPVVVDFDYDSNPDTLHPSIVFPTFAATGNRYRDPGTLRVIDGADCAHQFTLSPAVMAPASAAVGDLNGDGRAEIVAAKAAGGIVAWEYRPAAGTFEVLFQSADATGGIDQWNGPALHDLDDDGIPEVVYGAVVYDATGTILDASRGFPVGPDTSSTFKAYVSVVADVDEDGKMELVRGNAIHEWDVATKKWVAEPYFMAGTLSVGQIAVADFGNHPIAALGDRDVAEIVVIEAGVARVQRVDGTVIKQITMPGTGRGGPPTVADFDGDGEAEFASANGTRYAVFDLDCTMADATCEGNGILWSQPSQDGSSNMTGSSVFDFDANGAAEVVYADECYLRMYDGKDGTVRYSAARSSGTTYENPVVADVDGDFNTEIVSTVNDYGALTCAATDPLFPAAAYAQSHGVVVLRDELDRWAASRPVWSQHPYAVTHVGDRGETPKTSAVKLNWREPGLNNFRQNVQGDLEADGQADLTVSGDARKIECEGTVGRLEAEICNRGTKPMGSGTDVSFHKGDENGETLCAIPIAEILGVGECTRVSCDAELGEEHIDMTVVVDPSNETAECWEKNNLGLFKEVACGEVPVPELPVVL